MFHLWNIQKSHDDVSSQMKQTITAPFRFRTGAYMAIRCLDTQILNALRCVRLLSHLPDLEEIDSLQTFRKQISRNLTTRSFLVKCEEPFVHAFSFSKDTAESNQSSRRSLPSFDSLSSYNQTRYAALASVRIPSLPLMIDQSGMFIFYRTCQQSLLMWIPPDQESLRFPQV